MSKKSKAHRKKVAARNEKLKNKPNVAKIHKEISKTGMATPNEARIIAKALGNKTTKIFQRKTG